MDGNKIEHKNIIYVNDFNVIGGVETYVHELLKLYHGLDICVVYKTAHPDQLKRIKKYCKAYKHTTQKLVCDVCVINYDTSIIDFITPTIWDMNLPDGDKRGIYQGIHADYSNDYYKKHGYIAPQDPRIRGYLAITKHIEKTFSELTGVPQEKIIQCYNPLTIEKKDRALILISPTRLTPEKGSARMEALVQALDTAGVEYVWFIFTDGEQTIKSPNVVYKKPTLEIGRWLDLADYLVQLSDSEGCPYSPLEMLSRNKPCILTPLSFCKEMGIKDGVNSYILKFDCSNIDEIVKKITKIPKFKFEYPKTGYDKIFVKSKSHYKQEKEKKIRLKCTYMLGFDDVVANVHIKNGEIIERDEERAEELLSFKGCFEVCMEEAINYSKKRLESI